MERARLFTPEEISAIREGRKTVLRVMMGRPSRTCPACWDVAAASNLEDLVVGDTPFLTVDVCHERGHPRSTHHARYSLGECIRVHASYEHPTDLALDITSVRLERVRDITPDDAVLEGYPELAPNERCDCEVCARSTSLCTADAAEQIRPFYDTWTRRYGPESWEQNDWVCRVAFVVRIAKGFV